MLGPDLNGKGVVAKVGSEASVARKINSSDGGGGGGSGGTRSVISKRLEKKGVGANGSGCGRADATVQQKMNKMEKETKMLIELSKVQ
ncbi:uncharacterized protein MONOS_1704 [Monocercomonoides exilis]|uniref:uncharacterized protein n=1 Tax=Monocercomonoides exilis TaxID=2049356 RepID=UPI003559C5D9|nr:hypothetical protein MONOS_1704 [Monocercomonoides exilis]|eukprot:MONOS_1704.1-p1 / transcript=MONOS_1704.1 / gene=MONOS_1704 / organism=Monocercomonoides_exilis_PA203 / gene_product=unspecified product / transcript_product=unspecified product / location=Mono_scaffold00031:147336-147599(+) / protein_length=88 / sequence_SO=supercontig / SO=protein_coding / is_pseudo=false